MQIHGEYVRKFKAKSFKWQAASALVTWRGHVPPHKIDTDTDTFKTLNDRSDHPTSLDWARRIACAWILINDQQWLKQLHLWDNSLYGRDRQTGTTFAICLIKNGKHNYSYDTIRNITVWTVVQTVLTATFNSYGNRQISTPHTKSIPLNRSSKNSAQLIMSTRGPTIPSLVQIRPVGDSGQGVKYNKNYFLFIYTFFLRLAYTSDLLMDFYAR